jgi:hypothetical protein
MAVEDEKDSDSGSKDPGPEAESGESEGGEQVDISKTTAPSIGPNTVIEKHDPKERLARHDQSSEDAMGLDKRRTVIGGKHGASFGRQAAIYGIVIAVVAALVIGTLALVDSVDQAPASNRDAAPWADNKIESTPLQ